MRLASRQLKRLRRRRPPEPPVAADGLSVMSSPLVLLGRIVGVFGVTGEVRIESYSDPRMQLFNYQPWLVRSDHAERQFSGCSGREQGKGMVARLPGISDRDAAAALVGADILIERASLPVTAPGEYYWTDLQGLRVQTPDGTPLGTVTRIFATGANDVLVVRDEERERLIPFIIDRYITLVDLDAGVMVADWDPLF